MNEQETALKESAWAKFFGPKRRTKATKGAFGKPPFSYKMRSAEEVAKVIAHRKIKKLVARYIAEHK